jgi:hypothetical protein
MNHQNHCPDPDLLITLLYDDEGDPLERTDLETHVAGCPSCAQLLGHLSAARGTLGAWQAPRLPLGFAVVPARQRAWQRAVALGGGVAAAVLVVAGAAGLSGLEVTWNTQEVTIRTGWARGAAQAPPATSPAVVAPATAAAAPSSDTWVSRASAEDAPWRADFDLLATQLHREFDERSRLADARLAAALASATRPPAPVPVSTAIDQERFLARMAELIEQSEVRQQQNLALRVAELGREFQLRRQADLVQFQQGLARVERQRHELIRRVATQATIEP